MIQKDKRKASRAYYCTGCKAIFSGQGCKFQVDGHEFWTGHKVLQMAQVDKPAEITKDQIFAILEVLK